MKTLAGKIKGPEATALERAAPKPEIMEMRQMTSDQHLSFGQRLYRGLFKVFGPADVGPTGPPAVINPDDRTVPPGYHLETITDGSGNRRRIAVQNEPEKPA